MNMIMNMSVAREIKYGSSWLSEQAINPGEFKSSCVDFSLPRTCFRAFWRFLAGIAAVRPPICSFQRLLIDFRSKFIIFGDLR